jgi:hypothetical protein
LEWVNQVVGFIQEKENVPSAQEAFLLRVKENHMEECAVEVIRAVSIRNAKLAQLMLKNWRYISALQSKILAQAQIQEEMRKRVRGQINNVNVECNGRSELIEKHTEVVVKELDSMKDQVTQAMIDQHKLVNELKDATKRGEMLRNKMTSFIEGDDPLTDGVEEGDGSVTINRETGELDIDGYIDQNMATVTRVNNLMTDAFSKLEAEGGRALGVVMPLARAMIPVDQRLREMNTRVYKMMNPLSVRRRNFGFTVHIDKRPEEEPPMALPPMPPYDVAHDLDPKMAKSEPHSWIPYDILSRMQTFPKRAWSAEQIQSSNGDGREGPRLTNKKALFRLILQYHINRLEDDRGRDRGEAGAGAGKREEEENEHADEDHSSSPTGKHGKKHHKGKKGAHSPKKAAHGGGSPSPFKSKAARAPSEPRLSPGAFLYQFMLKHYGLPSLADQNVYQLLCTCLVYYKQFKRVKFFSDLIGLRPDALEVLESQMRDQRKSGKRRSVLGTESVALARRASMVGGDFTRAAKKGSLKHEVEEKEQLAPAQVQREEMKNALKAKIDALEKEGGGAGAVNPKIEGGSAPAGGPAGRRSSVSSIASDFSDDDDDEDPSLEPNVYEQWHLIFVHDLVQTLVSNDLFTKAMLKDSDAVIEISKEKAAIVVDTLLRPTFGDTAIEQLKAQIKSLPAPGDEPARIHLWRETNTKGQNLERAMADFQQKEAVKKAHAKYMVDFDDLIDCVVGSWMDVAEGWCEELRRAFLQHARWFRARKGASYQEIDPRKGIATGSKASGNALGSHDMDALVNKGMALPLISYQEFRKTISELITMDEHTVASLFYSGTEEAQKQRLRQLCAEWKAGYAKVSNDRIKERKLEIQRLKHAKAMKKARSKMKTKRKKGGGDKGGEAGEDDLGAGAGGALMAVMKLKAKHLATKALQAGKDKSEKQTKDAASGEAEPPATESKGWEEDEEDGVEWLYEKEDTKEEKKIIELIGPHRAGYSVVQGAKLHTHQCHYGSLGARKKHNDKDKKHHHHHKSKMISVEHPSSPQKPKKKKREVVAGAMRKFYYNRELRTVIWDSPFTQDLEGPTGEFGIDVFITLMMTRGVMQRHAKVRLKAKQARGRLTGWLQQRMMKRKGQAMVSKLNDARFVDAISNAKDNIFTEYQAVKVRYKARHRWYAARILKAKSHDLYDVEYDDGGDVELDVHKDFIQRAPESDDDKKDSDSEENE